MDKPTCKTCPYWSPYVMDEGSVPIGQCTVRASTIIPQDYMAAKEEGYDADDACRFASRHPVTYHCDGCGEHPGFPAWIESQRKAKETRHD